MEQKSCARRRAGDHQECATIRRARIAEGHVPRVVDKDGIAEFYATVAQGLALCADDGVGRLALEASVSGAMAVWDGMTRQTQ